MGSAGPARRAPWAVTGWPVTQSPVAGLPRAVPESVPAPGRALPGTALDGLPPPHPDLRSSPQTLLPAASSVADKDALAAGVGSSPHRCGGRTPGAPPAAAMSSGPRPGLVAASPDLCLRLPVASRIPSASPSGTPSLDLGPPRQEAMGSSRDPHLHPAQEPFSKQGPVTGSGGWACNLLGAVSQPTTIVIEKPRNFPSTPPFSPHQKQPTQAGPLLRAPRVWDQGLGRGGCWHCDAAARLVPGRAAC